MANKMSASEVAQELPWHNLHVHTEESFQANYVCGSINHCIYSCCASVSSRGMHVARSGLQTRYSGSAHVYTFRIYLLQLSTFTDGCF